MKENFKQWLYNISGQLYFPEEFNYDKDILLIVLIKAKCKLNGIDFDKYQKELEQELFAKFNKK